MFHILYIHIYIGIYLLLFIYVHMCVIRVCHFEEQEINLRMVWIKYPELKDNFISKLIDLIYL